MRIIVFDFDGVVCDSTNECMVTSWNAWQRYKSKSAFRSSICDFNKEEILKFSKIRPRVRGAGEYYVVCRSFEENIVIQNQKIYDDLVKRWSKNFDPFKKIFFEMRNYLRKININKWIELHIIYRNVLEVMKKINKQNKLYIATLKDRESVNLILNKNDLYLSNQCLIDQSQITTKLEGLENISRLTNYKKSDIVFIDDNVNHLLDPQSEGFKVFLPGWGNLYQEYLDIAKQNKIKILDNCAELLSDI